MRSSEKSKAGGVFSGLLWWKKVRKKFQVSQSTGGKKCVRGLNLSLAFSFFVGGRYFLESSRVDHILSFGTVHAENDAHGKTWGGESSPVVECWYRYKMCLTCEHQAGVRRGWCLLLCFLDPASARTEILWRGILGRWPLSLSFLCVGILAFFGVRGSWRQQQQQQAHHLRPAQMLTCLPVEPQPAR